MLNPGTAFRVTFIGHEDDPVIIPTDDRVTAARLAIPLMRKRGAMLPTEDERNAAARESLILKSVERVVSQPLLDAVRHRKLRAEIEANVKRFMAGDRRLV